MTVVQYTSLMPEYSGILNVFSNKSEALGDHSDTSAAYVDPNTSYQLIFEGTDFKYKGDTINSGHLDTLHFADAEGDDFFTLTSIKISLKDLTTALTEKKLILVLELLLDGNDKWTGGDANDYIYADKGNDRLFGGIGSDELDGGAGKDKLTGGDGEDYFYLYNKTGKDKVTDFDADGSDSSQDYVWLFTDDYKIKGDETRTIVDLGKGNQLILMGVDKADFTVDDIYFS